MPILWHKGHIESLPLRWEPPYTGVSTPPSPEIPKKSRKGVPGPPGPECQKSVEKVPNDPKMSHKKYKISSGTFRHFFDTPGRKAREHRSPRFGVGRRGSPRFVLICSDFPVFFRFVPICVPCYREYPDLFRFAPFSSDLFRFVFRTNQNKSGKPLSAGPFCKSPRAPF